MSPCRGKLQSCLIIFLGFTPISHGSQVFHHFHQVNFKLKSNGKKFKRSLKRSKHICFEKRTQSLL